jgi:hypothetical protein
MDLADLLKNLESQKGPAGHEPGGEADDSAVEGGPKAPKKKKEILDQAGVDALLASLFEQ